MKIWLLLITIAALSLVPTPHTSAEDEDAVVTAEWILFSKDVDDVLGSVRGMGTPDFSNANKNPDAVVRIIEVWLRRSQTTLSKCSQQLSPLSERYSTGPVKAVVGGLREKLALIDGCIGKMLDIMEQGDNEVIREALPPKLDELVKLCDEAGKLVFLPEPVQDAARRIIAADAENKKR